MKQRFRPRPNVLSILAALAITLGGRLLVAEDWPVVRGDTLGTGVAKSSLPDALEELWTYRAENDASFDATAVIADGIVYVGDSAGTFHAVRLSDGAAVWKKEFPDTSFAAGAAIDKDRLIVGDLEGRVRCLSIADGSELWSKELQGEIFAGPMPHDGNVLVTSESGTLACYNAVSGEECWPPFKIEAPLRCSPTIFEGSVMLAGCDSLLHLINVADGKETHTVAIDGPTGSTPAMHGRRVFFGTEGGTFFAIEVPAGPDKQPAVIWTHRDPTRGQPIRSAAAVTDRAVVYGSQGKAIFALDPVSSTVQWIFPTRSRVESSPVIAGNRVVAAVAGKILILDIANGQTIWEYDAGGSFGASPAVVDGRIILGNSDGTLYCFGAKSGRSGSLTTESTGVTEGKSTTGDKAE